MSIYVHPQGICDSVEVGEDTRVWAFAHVMAGARVGSQCNIGEGAFLESGSILGDRVTVKNHVMIWDGVQIANDVFLGPGVIFTNDANPRSPRMPGVEARYAHAENWRLITKVEQGASLGAGAVILPGITIGSFAMVAAGSVVTRSVLAHQLVLGNPARPRGWVCRCGQKLDDKLGCPACQVSYRLENGTVLHLVNNP